MNLAALALIFSILVLTLSSCDRKGIYSRRGPATVAADTVTDTEEMLYPDPAVRTMYRLRQLSRLIATFQVDSGRRPVDLMTVLPDYLDSTQRSLALEDAWRVPIRLTISDSVSRVQSAGPDQNWDSKDDLSLTCRLDKQNTVPQNNQCVAQPAGPATVPPRKETGL